MLSDSAILNFKSSMRGRVIEPQDADYNEARKVYNGMIDRRPRFIAKCVDVGDVITSVNFARDNGVTIAIRSGGHNAGGLGVVDNGLVIDLQPMKYTRVDPRSQTVVAGAGCTWGDIDHATHAFGLATPCGFISTTGVAGLTLGGGIGYLSRRYGLTIDNLLAVEMVLADGTVVNASLTENPDLFWAVRGGGGNFGVVTAFTFRAHPVSLVYGGPILWEMTEAEKVLRWYRNFISAAPDELNGFFAFLVVPPGPPFPEHLHNKKMCAIVWHYTGPMERAEEVFKPIRAIAPPAVDFAGPIPHPVLQSMFDPLLAPGLQWYWRADNFGELSDAAIKQHLTYGPQMPTLLSTMHLYPVSGAAGRVGKNDTAYSMREAKWAMVMAGIDPDPANNPKITKWAQDYYDALHPYSLGGAYVNFMMEEGEDRIKATYRDNYERLAKVKAKYDPNNLFHVNQNIKPSRADATRIERFEPAVSAAVTEGAARPVQKQPN